MRLQVAAAFLVASMHFGAFAQEVTPQSEKALAPLGTFSQDQAGVHLLEDYGSFSLYRVDASALAASAQLQVIADADVLQFAAYPFDTQRDTLIAPSPFSLLAVPGAGLQIVQFVGPVKQQWLDALSANGIKPVQYVASNGYVVWADAEARERLASLRTHASWLQFSSPFYGFLKIDPRLGARITNAGANDEVDVVVQVYRHDGDNVTRAFVESKHVLSTSQLGPTGLGKSVSSWTQVLAFANLNLRIRVADIPEIAERTDVTSVGEYMSPRMMDEKQAIILTGDFAPAAATAGYLQFLVDRGFSQNPNDYPIVDVTDSTIDEGGTGSTVVNTSDNKLHVAGNLSKPSRAVYFNNCTGFADEATGAIDSHGTLNAGIIADYDQRTGYPFQDGEGQHLGLGINPFGRIGSTTIFLPQYSIQGCGGNDQGVILSNWRTGAKISSNSWGSDVSGTYDASAQAYDAGVRDADPIASGNQELIYVFAAGNAGPGTSTIGSPGTAKNVITVGASESLRPFVTPPDNQCGADPANDPQNVVDFSSRGPAQGNRTKPEILAPGTHIQAGASNYAGYDGSGACVKYFPESPAQQVFTYSSGTSHSTPAVAGIASLSYWWIQHGGGGPAVGTVREIGGNRAPSPALMKAWLIAHPSYLAGSGGNDNLPSNVQGYGMPNMSDMFSDTPKVVVDQSDIFDNSGETRSYTMGVADTSKPVRIALAYTDAPGSLVVGSLVNDLDLQVAANGRAYRGNFFDHRWSIVGGTADTKNNYEAVFLPAGTSGDLQITVTGTNIAGDGIPNTGDATDQDFAMVCSNCILAPTYTVSTPQLSPSVCVGSDYSAGVMLDSILGYAVPVDLHLSGAPESTISSVNPVRVVPPASATIAISHSTSVAPGHYPVVLTATSGSIAKRLDLDLNYSANRPATPLLQIPENHATDVALNPTFSWEAAEDASSYLVEVAMDADFNNIVASDEIAETAWTVPTALNSSAQYHWRVTARNGCGQSTNSGDRIFGNGFEDTPIVPTAFTFSTLALVGDCPAGTTQQVLFADDMESGAVGWSGGGIVGGEHWTLAGSAHSGAHAFRANHDAFLATQQDLRSPSIFLPSTHSNLTLSFWNQQSLSGIAGGACFQGAVLEISTNNGATQTQVTRGLLTDPYDGVVSGSGSNPLQGKQAWCGNPQAYLNSVVDLSPYAGHAVQLIFAVADDTLDDGAGRPPNPAWAIDDVRVTGCIPN